MKDNGDDTLAFHSSDNGQVIVAWYKVNHANVQTQGGDAHEAIGNVDVMFHYIEATSDQANETGAAVIWLPKCSISGEASFEFSNEVPERTFKLTALIPDTPTGWLKPYTIIHGIEINNTNAG